MKNFLIFIIGMFSGAVLTIAFVFFVGAVAASDSPEEDMTFFDQPKECLSYNDFEVMQTIGDNYALAYEQEMTNYTTIENEYVNTELLVLITNDNGETYYDNQLIKMPKGKCAKQVGLYKYNSKGGYGKTVPIVKIMD